MISGLALKYSMVKSPHGECKDWRAILVNFRVTMDQLRIREKRK